MIHLPYLEPYTERYAALAPSMTPITVTICMVPGSPVVNYDPPALDSILSYAVVADAIGTRGLPNAGTNAYWLPLPLQILWQSADGLPLWAATRFAPAGESVDDTVVECKRSQPGEFTRTRTGRFTITPSTGRWRDRRTPRRATIAAAWRAVCIGDAAEIARLLAHVQGVGKRRSSGYGEIDTWQVEPAPAFAIVAHRRLTRTIPAGAARLVDGTLPPSRQLVPWTPPYWRRGGYATGWPEGTEVAA